MRNYTTKGTNAENFMQISLLLKKIWYLKDSRNGHFAMHYSSFRIMTKYQENFILVTSFIKKLLKIKMVTLLLGHPVYSNIIVYQKYKGASIKVSRDTRCLYASPGPKAEGVPTNNQRGRGSGHCCL